MGKVRVERPARITEKRKLFQEKTKERMAVATTPGLTSGRAMRQNALRYEQPSINAASSRSAGAASKKKNITHLMMGGAPREGGGSNAPWGGPPPDRRKKKYQRIRKAMSGRQRATRA